MRPAKSPTSALPGSRTPHFLSVRLTMIPGTVIELLVKRAWHWGLARIRRMRSADGPRETPATRRSSADRLPQEVVEMIIAQPIHDMQSLRVCSLTCFSWYIAAVPISITRLSLRPILAVPRKENRDFFGPNHSGACTNLACFPWSKTSRSAQ